MQLFLRLATRTASGLFFIIGLCRRRYARLHSSFCDCIGAGARSCGSSLSIRKSIKIRRQVWVRKMTCYNRATGTIFAGEISRGSRPASIDQV